jgi:acetyl esterase
MEILPKVQEALKFIHSVDVSHIVDKVQARRAFYDSLAPLAGPEEPVWLVEDKTIDSHIKVRIYRPSNTPILPAVVFFHGGGFNSGSLISHDRPLRQLANLSGVVVIAVDYRLAPENPFPVGLNDCMEATEWVIRNASLLGIDPNRVAVAGDSAGGTLATGVAGKIPGIKSQILIYPATNLCLNTTSWKQFADGPVITVDRMKKIWEDYAAGNTNAAPISKMDLQHMPDAFVITGEYDPLVDEGRAYAERLRQANVEVREKVYPKMIHGFFQMGGVIDEGREVIREIAAYIILKLT